MNEIAEPRGRDQEACPFCRIIRGEATAAILHRDALVLAIRDIRPTAPTHVLIIPTRHVRSVDELTEQDVPALARMFSVARKIAGQEGEAKAGYRLVINTGEAAGQSVHHLHMHLLAGRHMKWPAG